MLLAYDGAQQQDRQATVVSQRITLTTIGNCLEALQVVVRPALSRSACRADPRGVNGMTSSHKLIAFGARHVFIYGDRCAGQQRGQAPARELV
jgi:hypothetical protein